MIGQLPEKISRQVESGGILLDGMIRFVAPEQLEPILKEGYAGAEDAVPFAVTAFGDILTWEEERYIYKVSLRQGKADALAAGTNFFFEDLKDPEYAAEHFEMSLFFAAREKLGKLSDSECYAFVPLKALGGFEDIDHMEKMPYRQYLYLAIQVGGGVR